MKPIKYKRRVKPSCILPSSYIRGFYDKDPETLEKSKAWVEKNGLVILFTNRKALGHERVWLDEDGLIYIGWTKLPHKPDLLLWVSQINPLLVKEYSSKTKKETFKFLEGHEIFFYKD